MRSRSLLRALSVITLLAGFAPICRAAGVRDRITSAINGSNRATMQHTVSPRVLRSTDLGTASSSRVLSNVTLHFNMTAAQQADLTQLLSDQQNPNSANYHKWLTPEQFGARFGLSPADLANVSAWLTGQGFNITSTARSSTFITFSGTVGQVERAFGTSIHKVSYRGEQHISNVADLVLPSAIANVVANVSGVSDFRLKPRLRKTAVKVSPDYTATGVACISGSPCFYLAPGDFYTIYDVNPLLNNSINGTGISIAVIGQTDINTSVVSTFRAASGLSTTNLPTIVKATGYTSGYLSGDIDEAMLDVEWAGAVAPNATIKFVTVGANQNASVFDALSYAVDNNVAPIISSSYGECESLETTSLLNSINQTLEQANAQGQTEINAAGDSGATDCDVTGLASEGLAVDFPASSPYATAAGGTMFSGDVSNPSAYWNSSNTSNSTNQYTSSAKSYIPEVPWNETNTSTGLTAGGAGGGGASAFFSKPAWQQGIGVPNDGSRDLPDYSLNSGAIHDGYIVCSFYDTTDCTSGFAAGGVIDVFGGTSVATPTFAGMLALLEQKLGTGPLGNVGPMLYGIANSTYYTDVFNVVQAGSNAVPCIQGTPNCPDGGSVGFRSLGMPGYNQATGLGTIKAASLVNDWSSVTPVGTGGAIAPQCQSNGQSVVCTTTTTLTTSSALCGITSGTLPLSVTVTRAGSSGGTPTGTVQFYVDNVAVGAAVPLVNGAVSNYALSTAGLSSGGHNVSAVYSGDSAFSGSKGSLLSNSSNTGIVSPIDVVSTTSPDFSITPCVATTNVTRGSSASPIVLTITPTAGFTGSINLSANSDSGDAFNTTFSVKPVVISSASAATTSFVLTATVNTGSLRKPEQPFGPKHGGGTPWYAAGSGAAFACLILFVTPRRRRWGTLLALLLSVAAFGAMGCGSNTVTAPGGGGGGGGTTTGNASPGTYNITITATSGTLVHSVVLTYNIQ